MDKLWEVLDSLHFQLSAKKPENNTAKKYAKDLAIKKPDQAWETFYQAVQALEMDPGYPSSKELIILCQKGAEQDDQRLLSVIEQKSHLFDIVMFLRCVNHEKKIEWLNSNAFCNGPALFECLRQELQHSALDEAQQSSVVCGLCQLLEYSTAQFQYLLKRFLIYSSKNISIMAKLLPELPENGWREFGAAISFAEMEPEQMNFWDQCEEAYDWSSLYLNARPLLDAWNTYVDQSIVTGKWGQSLYNNTSNILINIMIHQLNSLPAYIEALEHAISTGEKVMLRWYEYSTQQRNALFACLAQIELLHYVWINNQDIYAKPFPTKSRDRLLEIILQYRFFWDEPMPKDTIQKEVLQLKNWLEQV